MFERFAEDARKVVFSARYEAAHYECACIETQHLLLGIIQQDRALARRFTISEQAIRRGLTIPELTENERAALGPQCDRQPNHESKRIMAFAAEEAERQGHAEIGCRHLLVGCLLEEGCCAARLLTGFGLKLDEVRKELWGSKDVAVEPFAATQNPRTTTKPEEPAQVRAYQKKVRVVIKGDLSIETVVFGAEISTGESVWWEPCATEAELKAFLRGVQAGSTMVGGPCITIPFEIEGVE